MSKSQHSTAPHAPGTTKRVVSMMAGALGLALAAGAQAQSAPPQQPQPHHGSDGPGMTAGMAARHEQHAARLKAILQLRPDQEPALAAYMDALAQQMGRKDPQETVRPDLSTTPRRLEAQRARLLARLAAFDARAEATRRFYGQLTSPQQKAFDALPPMMAGREHGHSHGMGRAMHGEGMGMGMGMPGGDAHDH